MNRACMGLRRPERVTIYLTKEMKALLKFIVTSEASTYTAYVGDVLRKTLNREKNERRKGLKRTKRFVE